jgi:hypothetical protein
MVVNDERDHGAGSAVEVSRVVSACVAIQVLGSSWCTLPNKVFQNTFV